MEPLTSRPWSWRWRALGSLQGAVVGPLLRSGRGTDGTELVLTRVTKKLAPPHITDFPGSLKCADHVARI